MNFAFFIHSLASDWNHGNAHFVRGVLAELVRRGHTVTTHEQADNWSVHNLAADQGDAAVDAFREVYPELADVGRTYDLAGGGGTGSFADPDHADVDEAEAALGLDERLRGADVVIVHEWTPPSVVAAVGRHRRRTDGYRLLFHDTHHRAVSEPEKLGKFDLSNYDGVLAFGDVLRRAYRHRHGVPNKIWTWHEAADTHVFKPAEAEKHGDLCWVGNWGDDERTAELHEYLLGPVKELGLSARVHGVRYPDDAKAALADAGITYGGYLPNFRAPELFARHRVTVHVPRRYYVTHLPGIPTIRPFEAMACGIPLVCSPWRDEEQLFRPGTDFLMVRSGEEMTDALRLVLADEDVRRGLIEHGLETVRNAHTCAHRVNELMQIVGDIA